jgi:hypothetical protein
MRQKPLFAAAALLLCGTAPACLAQGDEWEHEPINYSDTVPVDAFSKLIPKIKAGGLEFDPGDDRTFLRAILRELNVPESSQVLVFTKTSLQDRLISPRNPRALYFNDEVYVGWVPGGHVEVTAMDPSVGPVFYLVPRPAGKRATEPARSDKCFGCHAGSRVGNRPGLMVRSVFPDDRGFPILSAGGYMTDHDSPLNQRWGGWYVTGQHGDERHMGNAIAVMTDDGNDAKIDLEAGANLAALPADVDPSRYLAPTSDIVALMVMEHQIGTHNLFTEASYSVRSSIYRRKIIDRELGEPDSDGLEGVSSRLIERYGERILRRLLFVGEYRLESPVSGSPDFAEAFVQAGPVSKEGRSLRDLQLATRLFELRCSYMVYSKSFDELLPKPVRDRVLERLLKVLTGEDTSEDFEQISMKERRRILEILRETKPNLPEEWRAGEKLPVIAPAN